MTSGTARFTARLRSVGNPDFGQYAPISNPLVVEGNTLADIVKRWRDYQRDWDMGNGNCPYIPVKMGKRTVAHLAFGDRLYHPKRERSLSDKYPDVLVRDVLTDEEVRALDAKASAAPPVAEPRYINDLCVANYKGSTLDEIRAHDADRPDEALYFLLRNLGPGESAGHDNGAGGITLWTRVANGTAVRA